MNKDWDNEKRVNWCCAVMMEGEANEVFGDDLFEIKESKLKDAGLGLFTKNAIPKHVPIVKYPIHYLVKLEGEASEMAWARGLYDFKENKDAVIHSQTLKDYSVSICEDIGAFGDPAFTNNKTLCGHMCNDRGFHPDKKYNDKLNNAILYLGDVWSIKDIGEDEEIYVSYGEAFWDSRYLREKKMEDDIINATDETTEKKREETRPEKCDRDTEDNEVVSGGQKTDNGDGDGNNSC